MNKLKLIIAISLAVIFIVPVVTVIAQVPRPVTVTEYDSVYGTQDYKRCVIFESQNLAKINVGRCPEIVEIYIYNYWQVIDIGIENCSGTMFSATCTSVAYMDRLNMLERLILQEEKNNLEASSQNR